MKPSLSLIAIFFSVKLALSQAISADSVYRNFLKASELPSSHIKAPNEISDLRYRDFTLHFNLNNPPILLDAKPSGISLDLQEFGESDWHKSHYSLPKYAVIDQYQILTKRVTIESDENFNPPQPSDDKPEIINTKSDPIETFVEEEADFPGGVAEMSKFINENIDYPQEAIDLNIKGRVTVRFVVEKDGRISNVSVATPLAGCKACDKAAVKLVEKMPSWKAGKNGGREVRTWVTLPIKFEVQ